MTAAQPPQRLLEVAVEEIGDDNHDRAFDRDAIEEHRGGVEVSAACASTHRRVDRAAHQHLGMCPSTARREKRPHAVREEQQPDSIGVLHGREREDRCKLGRDVDLPPVDRAERHRPRDVDRNEDRQVALLDEFLDVRHPASRRDVPVDRPDVVPRQVLTHLRKLDPAPMKRRVIVARETGPDQPCRNDLQLAHTALEREAVVRLFAMKHCLGARCPVPGARCPGGSHSDPRALGTGH